MIKQALIAWFNQTPALVSVLSSRIYSNYAPENAIQLGTYMVLQTIHDDRTKTLSGYDGLLRTDVQADVYATQYQQIAAVHTALVAIFRNGGAQSIAGFTIRWVWLEDATDSYVYPDQADDRGYHRLTLTFTVWSNE